MCRTLSVERSHLIPYILERSKIAWLIMLTRRLSLLLLSFMTIIDIIYDKLM